MSRIAWLVGAIAGFGICYLFGALCAWDINASNWGVFWRFWCFSWAILWSIVVGAFSHAVANP